MIDVRVTYRVTRDLDASTSIDASCLSDEERTRAARFVHDVDRRDFLAAHVLLREALSRAEPRHPADWTFARTPAGKPYVSGPQGHGPLTFNLAHTRGLVACIVARGVEVGIDVEPVPAGRDLLDVARVHFAASEVAGLDACAAAEQAERFAELWTLKEAWLKATGAGIPGGLQQATFGFDVAPPSLRVAVSTVAGERPQIALFSLLNYRMAAAVRLPAADQMRLAIDPCASGEGARVRPRLLRAVSTTHVTGAPA